MTWPLVPLGDVFAGVKNGLNVKQEDGMGGLPITRIETISNGVIDLNKVGYAGLSEVKAENYLEPGDILFSHINSPIHVGRVALFDGDPGTLVHGMNLLRLKPDPEILDTRFAIYLLRSPKVRAQISRFVNKAVNQASISITNLKTTKLPIPPMAEQVRIAGILDLADEVRAKRRAALALLDTLPQSLFHQMFGQTDWPTSTLNEVSIIKGEYGANVASVEMKPGLPRYIRITDVTDSGTLNDDVRAPGSNRGDWEKYQLETGDLLFARSGATVGKTYLHRDRTLEAVFAGYLIRFRPNLELVVPEYLLGFTHSAQYKAWVEARQNVVAQPNINAKQYGSELSVPLPPLELQQEFARRVEAINAQRELLEKALAKDEELFASLQSRAFTGQI